jgi:hypothetical protein
MLRSRRILRVPKAWKLALASRLVSFDDSFNFRKLREHAQSDHRTPADLSGLIRSLPLSGGGIRQKIHKYLSDWGAEEDSEIGLEMNSCYEVNDFSRATRRQVIPAFFTLAANEAYRTNDYASAVRTARPLVSRHRVGNLSMFLKTLYEIASRQKAY